MEYTKELSGLNSWYKKLQYLYKKAFVKKQKTYILPTKFGLVYGLLCLVLLLMGMAYGNNLVYIVFFYLTVMGLAMAKITNDHVDAVSIERAYIRDAFAESDQILYVTVKNSSKKHLRQVEVQIAKENYLVKTDLKPEETQTLEIVWQPLKRGKQKIPRIKMHSAYPAGLFRAWKVYKEDQEIVVYPARRGHKEFPDASFVSQDSVGILKEIRDYKPGDSPKRIHWRSLAKNGQLRTLVHEGNEGQVCNLNWNHVQHLSHEGRLEQLTLWISLAETQGAPWNLKLPHMEYDSTSPHAYAHVLTELATWK